MESQEIDVDELAAQQVAGWACVVDERHVYQPGDLRVCVGLLGDDLHGVYACPGNCVRSISRLVMARPKHAAAVTS